ncbi:acetate kinase [Candidatus Synechococcus calcipolaris G9]|uniref:Acetate kinase n=1 Tax=Candidatus Synechococcus calcipolaris G9 TaxID=1497997 RepID=A0ABT6EZU4_9SYNE|nr:acetate kinase [Candidatus Synechococcus calcipolaris]MDG2991136.1 acetate kinase [Candidatus Synechococcus calcipolaris G9]
MATVLVLNAGSSSQKACLYRLDREHLPLLPPQPLWEGFIDWGHTGDLAELKVTATPDVDQAPVEFTHTVPLGDRPTIVKILLETLWQGETAVIPDPAAIDVVGHRVVHGGDRYHQPTAIDADVKGAIAQFAAFAPLHNPANLEGIEIIEAWLPDCPQVAVFDTAFHRQLPAVAQTYALPYHLYGEGIQRYGFHGISHSYVSERARQLLGGSNQNLRLITCHLGNGCSLAAVKGGTCIDTTMGFTPTAGLMMGTRCGDVDPGILLYLLRQGYSETQLDHLLNRQSGLLGVSGVSSDLRQVLAAIAQGNPQAQLAYDLYIYRLRSMIASLLPALGGLDALVFTAGVGENAATVRVDVCTGLSFLGLQLDMDRNQKRPVKGDIGSRESQVRVLVIRTQEDWAIARASLGINA